MNIIQKPSLNFSSREGYTPELIVIHIMAGSLSGTDDWFTKMAATSQVSAHYGIGLKGEIHQYVEEKFKAWHAGQVVNPTAKLLKLNVNPNLYTIGIEHEGYDLSKNPIGQLQASADLIKDICVRYKIPVDRKHIIGHYEIKASKPNCPSTDKSIIDKIISLIKEDELVTLQVPRSKLEKVTKFLLSI